MVDIDASFAIALLHKQYPGIGIEVGGIFRLGLDGLVTHLFGFLELDTLLAQIIGIVVQTTDIIVLPLQTGVISGIGFLCQSFLMEDITHDGIEVRYAERASSSFSCL